MYGLTKTMDLTFLHGKTVEQVCLGQYQTQVHLEEVSIFIECRHSLLIVQDGREIMWEAFPSDGISKLLGQMVSSVAVIDERTLEISFATGDRLSLFDDSDQFESFQLVCGPVHVVV